MLTIAELYDRYLDYRASNGHKVVRKSFPHIRVFKNWCANNHISYMSDSIVDEWCAKRESEPDSSHYNRISELRNFIKFTNNLTGHQIKRPIQPPNYKPRLRVPIDEQPLQKSVVSDALEQYLCFLHPASGKRRGSNFTCLRSFNRFIAQTYPEAIALTDDMVVVWCRKRECETCTSCNQRIGIIRNFIKYAIERGVLNVSVPEYIPKEKHKRRTPHSFTKDELKQFFDGTVNINKPCYMGELEHNLRKMEVPVFFRLLYSTGMRTNEARLLARKDVDIEHGIINIRHTKGPNQHRVALHPSMQELLKRYDNAIERIMPGRKVFFPDRKDGYRKTGWQNSHFLTIWKRFSSEDACPYDFRSNYAVRNIDSWQYEGVEWFDKLLILSRTMGHSTIKSTCYYYQLSTMFPNLLEDVAGEDLHNMLPDLNDFYNEEE